jgi:hypothetical protein
MAGTPKLRIKEYFGATAVQQMEITLEEAQEQLAYFFGKEGSSNIKISIEGQQVNSYNELVQAIKQDRFKDRNFVDVGLILSNEGRDSDSIWPKRPQP